MRSAWGEFIRMIFVTTGSQKFQFNRLLQKIDLLIEEGMIREEVFAQIGFSDYQPKHYEYCRFLDREGFTGKLRECRMVITHGGTGVLIGAVKQGKKVIAVPRLASYGEHVDDHQVQLLREFDGMNLICACYDSEKLGDCIRDTGSRDFAGYHSNTRRILKDIENFLIAEEGENHGKHSKIS